MIASKDRIKVACLRISIQNMLTQASRNIYTSIHTANVGQLTHYVLKNVGTTVILKLLYFVLGERKM